jgi:anti-sigma B factor antagonist
MNMTISTRQVGGITILDIGGRIVLGEESTSLRDVIRDLLKNGHKQILFNLGDVAYIDTTGLGSLVGALTTVRKQGGDLKLLNLPEKFAGVIQITKLYTVFDIMNDEAVAVKSFSQSTAKARA